MKNRNISLSPLLMILTFFSCDRQDGNVSMISTQRPIIQDLAWGKVVVKMPNGNTGAYQGDLIITPKICESWDYKAFGSEFKEEGEPHIGHIWPDRPPEQQGSGVLPYAIKGLLHKAYDENIIVIISIGMNNQLGVHASTRSYLHELKEQGIIKDFYILNSKDVPNKHNNLVRQGNQVYTLLHSTC